MASRGANLPFLREASVRPPTLRKYRSALALFSRWAGSRFSPHASADTIDDLLSEYFHYLYLRHVGRSVAVCTFYALVLYYPRLRSSLAGAAADLRGWARLAPSVSYPPIPFSFVALMAIALAKSPQYGQRYGFALILAFHCYLRCGELLGLRACDIVLPERSSDTVALSLRFTKTGPNQWVTVTSLLVARCLLRLRSSLAPRSPLFPFSASSLRAAFYWALSQCGIPGDFVLHSLRHGGATSDFLRGVPIEDVLHRGRWASNKSARRYIQAARAFALTQDISDSLRSAGYRAACTWHFYIFSFSR